MKLNSETTLRDFDAWSGAVDTKNRIIEEGKADDFDAMMEDLYPDGLTDTQLNDILWFEEDWIFDTLGITDKITCERCGEDVEEDEWNEEFECCTDCADDIENDEELD